MQHLKRPSDAMMRVLRRSDLRRIITVWHSGSPKRTLCSSVLICPF